MNLSWIMPCYENGKRGLGNSSTKLKIPDYVKELEGKIP
jgi:hypothetical protein